MRERPILFSGPMVRAILEERKTQTRRVVRWPKWVTDEDSKVAYAQGFKGAPRLGWFKDGRVAQSFGSPFGQPGDRLWVRETWQQVIRRPVSSAEAWWPGRAPWPGVSGSRPSGFSQRNGEHHCIIWRADGEMPGGFPERWRSPIFMPRWASRLTLEVTGVRVELLKDITADDVKAEGVTPEWSNGATIASFESLWDSINGKRAPWKSNPWVWVVEFKRVDEAKKRGVA